MKKYQLIKETAKYVHPRSWLKFREYLYSLNALEIEGLLQKHKEQPRQDLVRPSDDCIFENTSSTVIPQGAIKSGAEIYPFKVAFENDGISLSNN